ncbi:uncharacterized protein LOC111321567 [Stylophora pistillata]|uniref:uncharacterized protein LOC111321567 n=1 Tax=Stylophora pistillata TaxID=50429 RepID=UPI000C05257A|nr:uncharacterized protein LOC111321567 [Stylophora pistillata]XP_022780217.1 uncharacterized protein LOC111321567 [Stylophora pistillata]XP_022780218.1 uncharacterized protein LOC111321567 [Stylophora pistillata]
MSLGHESIKGTPLHRVASQGCRQVVEQLILSGEKVDAQTRRGRSALHYASENGHADIVALLIKYGAKVDLPNKWGRTALHYAASKYRVDSLQVLLKCEADPNKQDVDRQTPLFHAIAASVRSQKDDNVSQTLMHLISGGADVNIPDKSGITPLHIAAELGDGKICFELIKQGGAHVDARDQHGATPLHFASYHHHWNVMEALLSFGACSAILDNAGLSAELYMQKRRYMTITDMSIYPENVLQQFPSRELRETLNSRVENMGRPCFDDDIDDFEKTQVERELHSGLKYVPLFTSGVTEDTDLSSLLVQLNETEGLGLVKRTPEVELIEEDIKFYIETALGNMVRAHPKFTYKLVQAGSTVENTKVGEPDEVDYMCILTELSKACYVFESSNDPPGYLKICVKDREKESWNDFLDEDDYLIAERLHIHFHSLFDRHSEEADLTAMSTRLHKLRSYSSGRNNVGVTVDNSQTKPGSRLFFLWRGCHFKWMIVTVDLIPTIEIVGWPDNALVPAEKGFEYYHVIPKVSPTIQNSPSACLYWRISTSMAEKHIISKLTSPAHACYTICKSLKQISDLDVLFHENSSSKELQMLSQTLQHLRLYDGFINSYLIKMIFFREIENCKVTSGWSWQTVGNWVLHILATLLEELKRRHVSSYFLRNYNVLNVDGLKHSVNEHLIHSVGQNNLDPQSQKMLQITAPTL